MKKILLMMFVLVAGATSTYAINPVDCDVFYSMNNDVKFSSLMKYLGTDGDQAEAMKYVIEMTEVKMKSAVKAENEAAIDKALNFNLGNAKRILTEDQYKKYLLVINLTVYNKYNEVLVSEK